MVRACGFDPSTESGSPWENGYVESFKARLKDELAEWGDILLPSRSADRHRKLAPPL